eukprot:gene10827-biopygen5561
MYVCQLNRHRHAHGPRSAEFAIPSSGTLPACVLERDIVNCFLLAATSHSWVHKHASDTSTVFDKVIDDGTQRVAETRREVGRRFNEQVRGLVGVVLGEEHGDFLRSARGALDRSRMQPQTDRERPGGREIEYEYHKLLRPRPLATISVPTPYKTYCFKKMSNGIQR